MLYQAVRTMPIVGAGMKPVGEGIRDCGVDRVDLFVTTKLAAEVKSYKEAVVSIDGAMQRLGFEYVDMMIIHCQKPWTVRSWLGCMVDPATNVSTAKKLWNNIVNPA